MFNFKNKYLRLESFKLTIFTQDDIFPAEIFGDFKFFSSMFFFTLKYTWNIDLNNIVVFVQKEKTENTYSGLFLNQLIEKYIFIKNILYRETNGGGTL